jgi:uncharacterized protein YajQ (UPF0234 family)
MADSFSFDVVSKVNIQEVKNAVDQTQKEIHQRFDLKGTGCDVTLEEEKAFIVVAGDEYKLKAVLDILHARLVKRGVSLKALTDEKLEQALGGTVRQKITIQQGIASEKAKSISRAVRDSKLKVQTQIQGDQLRVTSKSKDDLQKTMTLLRSEDFGLDLEFLNYR